MGKLLEVIDLKKYYPPRQEFLLSKKRGDIRAVDGVSLRISDGETLGLAGESGCGKSTLGRTILRLEEPDSGNIVFRDTNIIGLKKNDLKWFRKEAQMVFQDPKASLDPRMTAGNSIEEALIIHGMGAEDERSDMVEKLLQKVGL